MKSGEDADRTRNAFLLLSIIRYNKNPVFLVTWELPMRADYIKWLRVTRLWSCFKDSSSYSCNSSIPVPMHGLCLIPVSCSIHLLKHFEIAPKAPTTTAVKFTFSIAHKAAISRLIEGLDISHFSLFFNNSTALVLSHQSFNIPYPLTLQPQPLAFSPLLHGRTVFWSPIVLSLFSINKSINQYITHLFHYASHTQQKLISRWGVSKHTFEKTKAIRYSENNLLLQNIHNIASSVVGVHTIFFCSVQPMHMQFLVNRFCHIVISIFTLFLIWASLLHLLIKKTAL